MEVQEIISYLELMLETSDKHLNINANIADKIYKHIGEEFSQQFMVADDIQLILNSMNSLLKSISIDSMLKEHLIALLKQAGIDGETDKSLIDTYEKALGVSLCGYIRLFTKET